MPQVFQVLRCYKCFAFQIHQTKKSNKFECKICGEKQSIKRHYGIGTGKDCRMHVQKLNILRGNKDNKTTIVSNSDEDYGDSDINENTTENSLPHSVKQSKWSMFVDEENKLDETEKPIYLGDREVCLEIPKKTKSRKFKSKVKKSNSEEYFDSVNNVTEPNPVRSCAVMDSEQISIQDDIQTNCSVSTSCQTPLACNNVDKFRSEKPLKHPVVLHTVNKSSKWAQYVETQDDEKLHSNILSTDDSRAHVLNAENLFSLCDDSDIDQLLNI